MSKRLISNYYQELKEIKLINIISYILENKQILQRKIQHENLQRKYQSYIERKEMI